MRRAILTALALPALLAATASPLAATALDEIWPSYERARLALVEDSADAARPAAAEMRRTLERLHADFSPPRAGVPAERADIVRALLPEATAAARRLEEAESLAAARDAFYALTQPLVRWREEAGGGPTVAYCPMVKRSWLQADGQAMGNPYYGRQMPTCGEIVSP